MTSAVRPATPAGQRQRDADGWVAAAAGMLFWIALPVVSLYLIVSGTIHLTSNLDRGPAGIPGTFVVTTHNCQQELCITGGTFTSKDKTVVAHDLVGVYRWKLGTSHKVIYNLDAADVIQLPGHWDPTGTVIGLAGAVVLLGVWAWCLRAALRRARVRTARVDPLSAAAEPPAAR